MNDDKKAIVRILFKLKIYETEGKSLRIYSLVFMNYVEPDFRRIKPLGIIGDCKNDITYQEY